MQQREASTKAQCVQPIGGLDSGEDLCMKLPVLTVRFFAESTLH